MVYWIPLFGLLEARLRGLAAQEPTGLKDRHGGLPVVAATPYVRIARAAFRPEERIAVLRSHLRQRAMLVQYAAPYPQKALQQMNVRLYKVQRHRRRHGLMILDAILEIQRDLVKLAQLRDERCHNSAEIIAQMLRGNWRGEYLFALRQALTPYRIYHQQIAECARHIEAYLATFADQTDGQSLPPAPRRAGHRTTPDLDTPQAVYRRSGADLTRLDGHSDLKLIDEIGTDMSRL